MEEHQINNTIEKAIGQLQADFHLACRFLVAFMYLERELLRIPSFRRSGAYAISWDRVTDALKASTFNELPSCLHALCTEAPKERGSDGEWPKEVVRLDPTLANAVECLRRMRNNLAHGSKGDGESKRNNDLLDKGLEVIAYIDQRNIVGQITPKDA